MLTILPRAARLALSIPITYRRKSEDHWSSGHVLNISETGVLFGPADLMPGTPIELVLSPPVAIGSMPPGRQVCVAEVVRTTPTGTVAARFQECRFLLEA